jgi:prefoldin alpha subunit
MTKEKKQDEEELQAKYLQYQLFKQQLNALAEKKALVDEQMRELNMTIDTLHSFETISKGDEIWSTLGSGSFVKSDIKDIESVMIAVGAGVVIKEKKERAIEILQGRMEELTKLQGDLLLEVEKISKIVMKLESEIELLAHKAEKE